MHREICIRFGVAFPRVELNLNLEFVGCKERAGHMDRPFALLSLS